MVLADAERVQLLFGSGEIGLGVFLGVFGLLKHAKRDCTVRIQVFRTDIRLVRKLLIVHCLEIRIEGIRNIRALNLQEQIALFHVVIETCFDVYNATTSEGDDRHLARDIRIDRTCNL